MSRNRAAHDHPDHGSTSGQVSGQADARPMIHAVLDVAEGLRGLAAEIDSWLTSAGRLPAVLRPDTILGPREMDVFERIGRGEPSAAIAAAPSISPQTVDTHRKSITRKTGARGAGFVRPAIVHVMSATSEPDGAVPSDSLRS